jgi:hypothetical protein
MCETVGRNSGTTFCSLRREAKRMVVDREILVRALQSAEDAKEWASELLTVHDQNLGRTTTKNKMWAEHLEKSIVAAKASISELIEALDRDAD